MQNKGLIKLFALLFGLVSIYQLSYTFVTSKVEKESTVFAASQVPESEEDYITKREQVAMRYLDSIGDNSVLGYTSYNEAKKKELNKGLDLKGGINVTLQISVKDILKGLANNTKNPVFNKALADADLAAKNSDDTYLDLFFEAFDNIKGDTKLASPDIFATKSLVDANEVNTQMSDDEVKPIIRTKIDESIVSAFEVLRERIDGFGVTQPNIQREGNSGRILVELPGARDIARAQELLSSTAQLEFWETHKQSNPSFSTFLIQANEKLKEIVEVERPEPIKEETELDSLLSDVAADSLDLATQVNPLYELLIPANPGSNAMFRAAIKDTATIGSYLRMPEIRRLLPADIQFTKFLWQRPATKDAEVIDLYALKSNREGTPRMSGDVVSDARAEFDQFNDPVVTMNMNSAGSKLWQKLTSDANINQTGIAVVLDNKVYTAPGCSVVGGITGGRTEISGNFTINETKDIANVLRAGKLPARAEIIQSEIVGPSLGQEAIDSGFMSFLIAMAIVLLWMIAYYGKAGAFADIALLLNILLIFGVLTSLNAVLTLPGIAGIVLTIGMSVDANVLIFERIKEELAKGKGKSQAVADGFGNALSSILDANITTGLTAIILFIFGSGPIKGFATTLLIGIITSLFTAIFITRLLVDWYLEGKGRSLDFSTSLTKNLFKNINIDFLIKRKIAYVISAILVAVGLFSLFFGPGLQQGVDFVGGRSYTLSFMNKFGKLEGSLFSEITSPEALRTSIRNTFSTDRIPKPLKIPIPCNNALVKFKDVTINYGNRPILKNINWTINPGDFWQLTGPNGSGKSTLLSMITGDNPKAFGQDIYLFGTKKGSGESVWDIKEKIGYYSPAMTNKFSGRHTIEYMLISGLTDSVGLYTIPTESQKRVVKEWLYLLDLYEEKDIYFNKLSTGKQRLVMTARAMVKHPPLLILDEPTAGMDDVSATLLVELVNKIAEETTTAIIFVSHRKEPFLEPKDIFSLSYSNDGSKGLISKT